MSKTAKAIMEKAISFLGTKESPAGSNKVIFNTDFYGRAVSGDQYAWCCAYVWDIFRMCNASNLFCDGNKTAYCPYVETWGKNAKLTVDKAKGQYGDIVLFDFYNKGIAGHIGFIEKKNVDGTYTCIEGNTSVTSQDNGGCVMRRTRNVSQIRCIIRPKYDKDTTKATETNVKKEVGKKSPTIALPTLRKGSKGTQVKYLQQDLNYIMKSNLEVDGDFGKLTDAALRSFQKKYGLYIDGIYGIKSHSKMSSLIK